MYLEYLFSSFYPEPSSSLLVRWYVSWMQEKSGSCIQSVTLCLFIKELKPLILSYQWTLFINTCYFVVTSVTAPKEMTSWLVGKSVYSYSYEGLSWIPALWRERYPDLLGNQAVPKAEVPCGMVLPQNVAILLLSERELLWLNSALSS